MIAFDSKRRNSITIKVGAKSERLVEHLVRVWICQSEHAEVARDRVDIFFALQVHDVLSLRPELRAVRILDKEETTIFHLMIGDLYAEPDEWEVSLAFFLDLPPRLCIGHRCPVPARRC